MLKKTEAKKVERQQLQDQTQDLLRENATLERFIEIFRNRNTALEGGVVSLETKLSAINQEMLYREMAFDMNAGKTVKACNIQLDRQEMQRRLDASKKTLREYEEAAKFAEMEYETLERELKKAEMREEGMLKVVGSTIKDVF
jgi:chromosome segregation ATPase